MCVCVRFSPFAPLPLLLPIPNSLFIVIIYRVILFPLLLDIHSNSARNRKTILAHRSGVGRIFRVRHIFVVVVVVVGGSGAVIVDICTRHAFFISLSNIVLNHMVISN